MTSYFRYFRINRTTVRNRMQAPVRTVKEIGGANAGHGKHEKLLNEGVIE